MAQWKQNYLPAQEMQVRSLGQEDTPGEGNPLQYSYLRNPVDKKSLVDYSPWGLERVRHDLATKQQSLDCTLSRYILILRCM